MKILFPCHELDNKKVDDCYIEEHHAAKLQGHDCFLFDHDEFVRGNFKSNIPQLDDKASLVLRSWMLNLSQYEELYKTLDELGYVLINTPEQYKNCHHFPESYDYTKEHTSKAIFIKEWDADILQDISEFFGDKDFLMKDFVKSAKGVPGLFKMPTGISGEDLFKKVEEFVEHRGDLFSEGLVFKEFVDLKHYGENVNEYRLFFYERRLISSSQNSNVKEAHTNPSTETIDFVKEIALEIDSNFFTIDIAEMENGEWMIIETGDGQVSGLSPGQNCLEYYAQMEASIKS
jgi:dimeric dUTPase (all-alpha-NTP-PPase superfamily)